MMSTHVQRVALLLALLLTFAASAYLIRGVSVAVSERGSWDLNARALEYRLFAERVYPDDALASNALPGEQLPNTVYPPYAFPMFAPFFVTGSPFLAGLTFGAVTLLALIAIGAFGRRELSFADWRAQVVGAVAGLAIAHNSSVIAIGQFSIISMGLIILQLDCLRRGKVMTAGLCWAFAMIKPQIAIAFLLPFLLRRRWRGLVFGLLVLAALSAFTCFHTRVSPLAVIEHWVLHDDLRFIAAGKNGGSSSSAIFASSGVDPRLALWLSLLAAASICAAAWIRARRGSMSLVTLAAVCAIVGRVFLPHRSYDNIMLFPALIALLAFALDRPSLSRCAWAGLFGISLWLPWTSLLRSIWLDFALLLFWGTALIVLMREAPGPERLPATSRTS